MMNGLTGAAVCLFVWMSGLNRIISEIKGKVDEDGKIKTCKSKRKSCCFWEN